MKKLLLAAPIAAVALAIARYFVIITSLDPETGFSNKPLPVILFSAVLILVAAAPIALRFVMKKLTDDRLNGYYTCKMPVYAISAAIAPAAPCFKNRISFSSYVGFSAEANSPAFYRLIYYTST